MDYRLNVKFIKPDWADTDLIRQHQGWDTFGLSLIVPEERVMEKLETLYALPGVGTVEVVHLKEED